MISQGRGGAEEERRSLFFCFANFARIPMSRAAPAVRDYSSLYLKAGLGVSSDETLTIPYPLVTNH
jgi:hypothetical protein